MHLRRLIAAITLSSFLSLGLQNAAMAAPIGTQQYLGAEARSEMRQGQLANLESALTRADVQARLQKLGVNPADALVRASALTDSELATVSQQLDQLPAGGDGLLAVIGIVFIVLLILEITGVTDIFKKI